MGGLKKKRNLSQKWDETKHGLMRRYFLIFDLGGLGFMVERRRSHYGFPIVQAKRRKRRREEIQVWNSNICCMDYLYENFFRFVYGFVG